MAKRRIIQLIDDLDNRSDAARTLRFSVDDRRYEIDLTDEHIQEFTEVLKPYVRAARAKPRPGRKPTAK